MNRKFGIFVALLIFCVFFNRFIHSTTQVPSSDLTSQGGGPAAVLGESNIKDSPYSKSLDFYNMESKDSLIILSHFKTSQQKTEFTCGPSAAFTVISYLDPNTKTNEEELSKVMGTNTISGTTTKGMLKYFGKDQWVVESSVNDKTPETYEEFTTFVKSHLENKMPIIVENVEWGGHWRVIIGYDTMGDQNGANDILIMADPYDTTDHNQDGYTIVSAQRFFYMWFDAHLFPKNEQKCQWLSVKKK